MPLTKWLFIQRLPTAGRPRVHALSAGPPPQGASVQPQWNVAPLVSTGGRQTVSHRGEKLHVSACFTEYNSQSIKDTFNHSWEIINIKLLNSCWMFFFFLMSNLSLFLAAMGLPVLSLPFSVEYFRTKSTASYVGRSRGSLIPFLVMPLNIPTHFLQNHIFNQLVTTWLRSLVGFH